MRNEDERQEGGEGRGAMWLRSKQTKTDAYLTIFYYILLLLLLSINENKVVSNEHMNLMEWEIYETGMNRIITRPVSSLEGTNGKQSLLDRFIKR